jgi:hypothetical protein
MKIPCLDGTNYRTWKLRMRVYLNSLGLDVWSAILIEYESPVLSPLATASSGVIRIPKPLDEYTAD